MSENRSGYVRTIVWALLGVFAFVAPGFAESVTIKGTPAKAFKYNGAAGSVSLAVTGGFPRGTFTLTASTTSDWIVIDQVSLITKPVKLSSKGAGRGSVKYRVLPLMRSEELPRTGTITIGGGDIPDSEFLVIQTGMACKVTLKPTSSGSLPNVEGGGWFAVTAPAGCAWNAIVDPLAESWLEIDEGDSSGEGPGTVFFAVGTNMGAKSRAGKIYVIPDTANPSQKTFSVKQAKGNGAVAAPTFSLGGGTYTSIQSVALSTKTVGASIRYTTDDSTPTSESGTLYTGPIPIASSLTLKAIAFKSGWLDSAVASATYTIMGNYSVSGTISAATGLAMDSDVNDVNVTNVSNNSFGTAQQIGNPVMVGGYANVAWEGADGNTYAYPGDEDDYYEVDLTAGQVISLTLGDPIAGDLDLYLYDQYGDWVDDSLGTDQTETIVAPASGTYYVRVHAYEGATNYVLAIGLSGASVGEGFHLSAEFVPGEVLVQLKKDSGIQAASAASAAEALGLELVSGSPDQHMRLMLPTAEGFAKTAKTLGVRALRESLQRDYDRLSPERQKKWDTLRAIKALRKRADVLTADPNYIRHTFDVSNDQYYGYQWHYPLINLSQAWDVTHGDTNVIVAVVDTGVLLGHPDLAGKLTAGYDFISDATRAADGGGRDSNPDDPGDKSGTSSSSFHGTHVAGTIAATTNNSTGVAGVGWNVKVMPVRVLGQGGGTSDDIINGVKFAAGLSNASGTVPAQKADIINLSLGGGSFSQTEQNAYTAARNAGVIIIAAAGNSNSITPSYPASYTGVVSVSSVDPQKNRAPYSNYGQYVAVAAPGGDTSKDLDGDGYADGVLSTGGDDSSGTIQFNYRFMQGTSMASPHMAGVVALMKSADPGLTAEKLDAWLAAGDITQDIGTAGKDQYYGYGLIDASKAVAKAKADAGAPVTPTPVLSVNPGSLTFGTSETAANVSVGNGGTGSLSIQTPTSNAAWLTITPVSVASGLGTYTVHVSRAGLGAGTYTGKIRFTPITGGVAAVDLSVIMQVQAAGPGPGLTADAGLQYVLLVDPVTWEAVDQFEVSPTNGLYDYSFSDVPYGNYMIWTGTDSNNDGIICDSGEACGAYLTLEEPVEVAVHGNMSSLDFGVSFVMQFQNQAAAAATPPRPLRVLRRVR